MSILQLMQLYNNLLFFHLNIWASKLNIKKIFKYWKIYTKPHVFGIQDRQTLELKIDNKT